MRSRQSPTLFTLLIIVMTVLAACDGEPALQSSSSTAASTTLVSVPTSVQATQVSIGATPSATEFDKNVDIGGYGLHIICRGQGSPTVVLESPLAAAADEMAGVQGEVQKFTQVCAYDRAGLGQSGQSPKPRTSQTMAQELHTLLANAGIQEPYVLAAHSFGAFNARLFTSQYPREVVGVVFEEGTPAGIESRWLTVLPKETASDSEALKGFRAAITKDVRTVDEGEVIEWATSRTQVLAAGTLGDIPLIVITRGQNNFPELSLALATKLEQVWQEMQKELANLSSKGTQVIAARSGHCVHCVQPDIVVNAIRQLVEAARKAKR